MKILFVVNPVAGKKKAIGLIPLIEGVMNKTEIEYQVVTTQGPREAIHLSAKGLGQGYDTIVAVGGDGTVNEVANGIIAAGYGTLGIIPGGTGNDLAKTLGISSNFEEAISLILKEHSRKIDIGEVKGKSFINVASVGLDAEIAKNTEGLKKYFKGKLAYIAGLLKTLRVYKTKKMKISLDDKVIEKDTLLVAVGNGKYYGGGMKICPMASIDDGYFHVCIINKISKIKLLFIFPSVFKGSHGRFNKYVEFYKTKVVKIEVKERTYINIDGEIFEGNREIIFTTSNGKLDILC